MTPDTTNTFICSTLFSLSLSYSLSLSLPSPFSPLLLSLSLSLRQGVRAVRRLRVPQDGQLVVCAGHGFVPHLRPGHGQAVAVQGPLARFRGVRFFFSSFYNIYIYIFSVILIIIIIIINSYFCFCNQFSVAHFFFSIQYTSILPDMRWCLAPRAM